MSLVIFLVLLVAMYAVLIVPQQRRVKAQRAVLNSLTEGDVVLTSAGKRLTFASREAGALAPRLLVVRKKEPPPPAGSDPVIAAAGRSSRPRRSSRKSGRGRTTS